MSKFRELDDKKKRMVIIVSVLVVFIGISLAYVVAQLSGGATSNANVTADTTDSLQFSVSKDISLNPTQFNVTEGGGGLSDTAVGTATLLANSTTNSFSTTYYVYFNINSNNYIYTTEDQKPEIVLTITDPTGQPVTEVSGLTYVNAENADGTIVSGFDITTKSGIFNIASDYAISSISSTDPTVQNWTFTVTFINLTTNQTDNGGKTLSGEVILSREEYDTSVTLANYIVNTVYTGTDGDNGLYLHDGAGTYGSQEAGDNSYRYSGANPNNYVCFGSTESPCPAENLYRIIGAFDDDNDTNYQIKLIKEDYVTSAILGTNSRDYYGNYINGWGEEEYYKGDMAQSDIAAYRWNYDANVSEFGSSNWSTSELNNINLNINYLNYLGESWSKIITDTTWNLGGISENDFFGTVKNYYDAERNNTGYGDNPTISNGKIGLMYASDYGYANEPIMWENSLVESVESNNWMYMGMREWTITTISFSGYNAICVESYKGNFDIPNTVTGYAVRPAFYIESNVELSGGVGTSADPYRIQI